MNKSATPPCTSFESPKNDTATLRSSIFLHGGWRCSSTYVWSKFRELADVVAYYEPFHENNASYTEASIGATRAQTWNSRHPQLAQPYAAEYLPLLQGVGVYGYREEFAVANYFPRVAQELAEVEYLKALQAHALQQGRMSAFGFSRSLARASAIKAACGGHHLVLMRDPIQQWLSCRSYRIADGNCYFELCHFLILALAARGSVAGQFAEELGLPKVPTCAVGKQLEFLQRTLEPWSDEFSFRAFLIVYMLSMLSALPHADLMIDMDHLGRSARYRKVVMQSCYELTGVAPNFSDCLRPLHNYQDVPVRFEFITTQLMERIMELEVPTCLPVSSSAVTHAQALLMSKVCSAQSQAVRQNSQQKNQQATSWLQQTGSRLLRTVGFGA